MSSSALLGTLRFIDEIFNHGLASLWRDFRDITSNLLLQGLDGRRFVEINFLTSKNTEKKIQGRQIKKKRYHV